MKEEKTKSLLATMDTDIKIKMLLIKEVELLQTIQFKNKKSYTKLIEFLNYVAIELAESRKELNERKRKN